MRAAFAVAIALCALACAAPWGGSIGAILGRDNRTGRVYVREVPPAMGAARAGIREGDEILEIDGTPVIALSAEDVRKKLRGGVGTTVTLTIAHEGEVRTVRVERSPLQEGTP